MNGKNVIFGALENNIVEKVPWVPYTGVQIGNITGYTATKLLQDKDALVNSLIQAEKLYAPDGMPVVFDLQIEAEILGCNLMWDDKTPPSVISHPFAENKNLPSSDYNISMGRLPVITNAMNELSRMIGGRTALYGLVTGPLTLAAHLRGMQLFMDFFEDENFVKSLIEYCTDIFLKTAKYYHDAGMPVIAAVDPMVSQIGPETFEQFLAEPYSYIFEQLKSQGIYSSLFVCGDAIQSIEAMCKTNTNCISVDENIDIVKAKEITDRYNVVISGNIPLTTIMLHGSQKDNQKYSADIIRQTGNSNFILAPGCDMPYDTPVDNLVGIGQLTANFDAVAAYIDNYTIYDTVEDVELPDYSKLDYLLIEVYTVDSKTCAACGYMTESAKEMIELFGESVRVIERKITCKENIQRIKKLGIKNLPVIMINGEVKFVSRIPNKKILEKEIVKSLIRF